MISQNLEPEVVKLDDGAGGGWIGGSKAKEVLLYFHGSGYVNIASEFLFQMLGDLVILGKKEGKGFSVFAVEYGLAPKATYPLQLIQAAHALNYLIEEADYKPENIYIGGDSAGAHLAMSLLSSLSHPHPTAPPISFKNSKLAGAFLISPWVTFKGDSISMKENADKDFVIHESLRRGSDMFMDGAKEDEFNVPLSASPEWWRGLGERVREIGVLVGGYEIFRDDVRAWVGKVKVYNPDIEFFLAPAEIHDQAVVDRGLGLKMPKSEELFREWMMKRLKPASTTT